MSWGSSSFFKQPRKSGMFVQQETALLHSCLSGGKKHTSAQPGDVQWRHHTHLPDTHVHPHKSLLSRLLCLGECYRKTEFSQVALLCWMPFLVCWDRSMDRISVLKESGKGKVKMSADIRQTWEGWLAGWVAVHHGITARIFDLEKSHWDCHKSRRGKYFYFTATGAYNRQCRQSIRGGTVFAKGCFSCTSQGDSSAKGTQSQKAEQGKCAFVARMIWPAPGLCMFMRLTYLAFTPTSHWRRKGYSIGQISNIQP